jgi:site-specific recombinase XerD
MDLTKIDAWMQAQGHSPGTRQLRLSFIKRFIKTCDPVTCTMSDVAVFMANDNWKPASRASARSALKVLFEWLKLEGLRDDSPMDGVKPVKVNQGVPHPCPEEGFQAALRASDDRTRLAVMLAGFAGLRRAEIAGMHGSMIGETQLRVTGKGSKTRVVPIHPDLEPWLAPYRGKDVYLFPSGATHLTPTTIGRLVRKVLPDGYSTHSLRHRFASQVHANSKDLRAVQTLLGHSSLATTQIYVNVSSDQLANAVGSLARLSEDG